MKVIIAGDYSPHARGERMIADKSYTQSLAPLRLIISDADVAIVNFESTIAPPSARPIEKYGPALKTSESSLTLLKWLGFDTLTLANNHFYDYGDEGVKNSLKLIDQAAFNRVGGGNSPREAAEILYLKRGDKTLAIINICEHEYSIAEEGHGGSNPLNPIQQFYDIIEAKANADYVLVIVHGGHETFQLPSPRMVQTYRYFIDCGADAVVNHHQHCFSGMEWHNGHPIYYGLGNFLFDLGNQKKASNWNEGFLAEIDFTPEGIKTSEIPYTQFAPGQDNINLIADLQSFSVRFHNLSKIIADDKHLRNECEAFYSQTAKGYTEFLEPYRGRLMKSAYSRGLLPSLIGRGQLHSLQNKIECESHLDRLRFALRLKNN